MLFKRKSLVLFGIVVFLFPFVLMAEEETIYLRLGEDKHLSKDVYQYDYIVNLAAGKYGINPAIIKSIIKAETNFHPSSISSKGAKGLMQLMPETAFLCGVKDIHDPVDNIFGGARYLHYLFDLFGDDLSLVIAAYNAGPERVKKYGGIPPYQETVSFVKKVLSYYEKYTGDMKKNVFSFSDKNGNMYFSNSPQDERYRKVE